MRVLFSSIATNLARTLGLHTLVGRISSTFFALAIILAGLQYLLISRLWNVAEQESRQKLEWHLAEELSIKLQELLNHDSVDLVDKVNYRLSEFETVNPRISLSIVDSDGSLVPEFYRSAYYPRDVRRAVPVELINKARSIDLNRRFPLYGPSLHTSRDSNSTIFSIGEIFYRGRKMYLYAELDNSAYSALSKGLESTYIFLGGGLTSLALLLGLSAIGFLSINGMARRFRAFTAGVSEIAGGSYSARVPVSGKDEIANLGNQINHMAEQIEQSVQSLKENDRWRREMTASLSHDLRTPLAAMLAHNEQLMRNLDSNQDRDILNRLSIFERNLNTMHEYIEGVLELSKLESNQFQLEVVPFHILEIVENDIIHRLLPLAEKQSIKLESIIPTDAKLVYFDITLFQRVMENLISNALKYSNGKSVRVGFEIEEDCGWVDVTDDGCGIHKESLSEILKPFTRGDSARTSSNPGSGLGLAIVSLILKAHGSALEIISSPGNGTRVRFRVGRTLSKANEMINSVKLN